MAALTDLVCDTGATNVVVMDAFNDLWCRSQGWLVEQRAFDALAHALSTAAKPLNRGGKIDVANERVRSVSFAGVYVLILLFDARYERASIDFAIRRALPRIEALTTALPPPDGPGGNEAEGKLLA